MRPAQRSLRVVHLRATGFFGGPERQILNHAALAKSTPGTEVAIASFSESRRRPELLDRADLLGIETHCVDVSSPYDWTAVTHLRAMLRTGRFDILCTHDYRASILGMLARRGLDVRWVAFSRGITSEGLKTSAFHLLEQWVIRWSDKIVAVSHAQARRLCRYGLRSGLITVIHNAIDVEAFQSVQTADLRARFKLPPASIIAVAAGRFTKEKGHRDLIDAASIALVSNPNLRFILFGDGPLRPKLTKRTQTLGISDRVLFPGFECDIAPCIKAADMLINPSHSEGLPNVVLEAMAIGVPVVATSVGGVPELLEDGLHGLLVAPHRPRHLTDQILRLASSKHLQNQLAVAGRSWVEREFSVVEQSQRLTALYAALVPGR